jgi:hypothetical protein
MFNAKCIRKSDIESVHFTQKFSLKYQMATVMGSICKLTLERDKQYELCCAVFSKLLCCTQIKAEKRSVWWHRFVIDLKHLRRTKDALRVTLAGLEDATWVKTG